MMGNRLTLGLPKRIVSLVPSQTELLYDLGLNEEVVGITKFCVHPHEWYRNKKRVGGTKSVHTSIIRDLTPDLVIANKEENTNEQVGELAAMYPTWVSDIKNVADAINMIESIGSLVNRVSEATAMAASIRQGFANLLKATKPQRVLYLIWRNPWMCAGGDTFISDIITTIGWKNVVEQHRYPEIRLDELCALNPTLILLSSEPYPFKEQHIAEIGLAVPDAKVMLVDGEMFSWYGSRMLKAIDYFREIIKRIDSELAE